METHKGTSWVPPESGPDRFRKMREQIDRGEFPEEFPEIKKSSQPAIPKKKLENVSKSKPEPKYTPNFRNGASAMDAWQKEQAAIEERRFDKAA